MYDETFAFYGDYEESNHSEDPFGSSNSSSSSEHFPSDEESFEEDHYTWDSTIGGREVMLSKDGHVVFKDLQNPDEVEAYLTFSSDDSSDESDIRIARTTKKLRQSAQTIIDVIKSDMSLPEIQDVIKKESFPIGGFEACFKRKIERLNLFKAVLKQSSTDILEFVLENGLDPNTTWSRESHEKYTTLLQLAVEHGNPKAVELLVNHGAIVNKGYPSKVLQGTLIDASGPMMHNNALSTALKKDKPELMKPLVEHYDGKTPALLLALDLGAAKCAEILIEDEKQKEEIKAGKIPLDTGIRCGVKLIPKLYELGSEVYTKADLDDCLYSVLDEETYKSGEITRIPPGLDKRMTTLIELGADVNCKVKRRYHTLFEMFLHAYAVYGAKQEKSILSVLLEHGAIAKPSDFRSFASNQISMMFHKHTLKRRQNGAKSLVRRLISITKEKLSMIKKANNAYASGRESDRSRTFWNFLGSSKDLFGHLLREKHPERPHCKEMMQLVFDVVLTFDVADDLRLYSMGPSPRCICLYNIGETFMLLQRHSVYQEHLAVLDDRQLTSLENRRVLSYRFPQVRTLTKLAHVEIFNNLRFPKQESVESLGLPKLLQDYVCLVRS